MKEEKILKVVNLINNGDTEDIEKLFGGLDKVLSFLENKGYLHLIDPFNPDFNDSLRNTLIYNLLQSEEYGKPIMEKLIDSLSDITKIGNEYWVDVREPSELADLFQSYSRDTSPRDIAKAVLDEDWWEPFWDTTDDVYRDVIEELNPQNKEILKEKIVELLSNQEIEITGQSSDLMEELAEQQGHSDYFVVNNENINQVVDDEETMKILLKDELSDLRNELFSIHSNAFNGAYNDEYYEKVWDELKQYIDSNESQSYIWGKTHRQRYTVTDSIKQVIKDWFYTYKGYDDDFNYYGSYLGIIEQLMDQGPYDRLDFSIVDYPDYRKVDEYINLYFKDYI